MEHDNDNENPNINEEEEEEVGSLLELNNLFDIKSKQVLDSLDIFKRMEGFRATQRVLHQAEMLNPVKGVVILVDSKNELYLMSSSHDPAEVLHLIEIAKKRLT